MLKIVFNFRGNDYKGNRIPESFHMLQEMAQQIKKVHLKRVGDVDFVEGEVELFDFSFYTSGKTEEQDIENDDSLLNAINEAF